MNYLPQTWQTYLHIATDDHAAVRRGRLLQICLILVTAVLALRLILRLNQEIFTNTLQTYVIPLGFFLLLILYVFFTLQLIRQIRFDSASHLLLLPPLIADAIILLIEPLALWVHPLFILLFMVTAVALLPRQQSWPYLLVTIGTGFYLQSLGQPGIYFALASVATTAVVWAIKREQTHIREALSQATDELSHLNATLQQRIDDQLIDLERRNERLEFSLTVIRTANESLELEALLKNSVKLIYEEFDLYHVSILLLDDTTRFVVVQEAIGEASQQLKTEEYRLGIGSQSLVGQATQRRQAQYATNTADDPFFLRHPLLPETSAELAVPLITRGYLVGALDMQSRDTDTFTPEDITIVQLIADQLANSIDNALLFKQLEKRTEQMTELQNITSLMTLQNDVQSALNVLAQRAKILLQADGTGIFLWQEETNTLELVLNIDMGVKITGYNLDSDEGLAGLSFREGETYVIDNYNTWSGRLDAFAEADFQALMTVPLKERDRPIGVLSFTRRTPDHPFNVEEIQLIELLAAQAGTILTNQELFENLHVLVQRERVLNKITAEVRHSLNADTIVESAAQQLGEVLGNKQVHVRLYPPQERYMRPDANKVSHG